MVLQRCRNVIEELVVEEAQKQVDRLSSPIRENIDIYSVVAYVLNRLPPMYATTSKGLSRQQKRANTELKQEISRMVARALLGVRVDTIKIHLPLPPSEIESEERSLANLQKILIRETLRWRDVPDALEEALMTIKVKGVLLYNHENQVKRSNMNLTDYLKRSDTEDLFWKNKEIDEKALKGFSLKEFVAYMAPATWNFVNTLEKLVDSVAKRQISALDPSLSQIVKPEEVCAYALNRLPPMYATSESGLRYWRNHARIEMSKDILTMVRQGIVTTLSSPGQTSDPLPTNKYAAELEPAIKELQDILQITDIDWRNVSIIVQDAIEQSKSGRVVWVPRNQRNSMTGFTPHPN